MFLLLKMFFKSPVCFFNPEQVVKTLLEISVEHSWAKVVHSKLICMLTNMLYQVSDLTQNGVRGTHFVPERIDLLGGIDYICLEVCSCSYADIWPFYVLTGIFFNTPVLISQSLNTGKCIIFTVD